LTFPDFQVRLYETIEYSGVARQKLRYPVIKTEFVSAIVDDEQVIYEADVDFTIDEDGYLVWADGSEPTYDSVNERGEVIVVAYFANPVYVVVQSLRELRITQEYVDGEKQARRLPQQVLVRRDFLQGSEKLSGG
jgi:hypothetical protein